MFPIKIKKKVSSERSRLIATVDKYYSRVIRLKAAQGYGEDAYCICFTCGRPFSIKNIDCGHFISRKHMKYRFDENNTFCQCHHCNRFDGEDSKINYERKMIEKYGLAKIEEMKLLSRFPFKLSLYELGLLKDKYMKLSRELSKQKGVKW